MSLNSKYTDEAAKFWRNVWGPAVPQEPARTARPGASPMEADLADLVQMADAPSRTVHNTPLVRSSPLSPKVRAMMERREFGRPYNAVPVDLSGVMDQLPDIKCPEGDVVFLAADSSFDELNLSVDCLLRRRKSLLASSVNASLPRKNVFILGAGPGGLMAAIQLALRDHRVIVCEQRDAYARNRYIGVYKEVTHLMAALGMPEGMTYDFSQYRGKRGIMLADIQTFLHGVALKLGVIIYTGAVPRVLNSATLQSGEVELHRAERGITGAPGHSSIGITRWQHDTVSRVRSGVRIRFDTIVEATGGRSGLRELFVGRDNIVSILSLGRAAAAKDPTLKSFFDDPEDHCAEYVESGYGCPPGLRERFAEAILAGGQGQIPDEVPCFVSNIDADIFITKMRQTPDSLGLASRIGDRDLNIPHDWVVLECRVSDQSLSRYHIEGPLPQTFSFGGKQIQTKEILDKLNPVSLLLRILYAMGVPFDAVDKKKLIDFYTAESSFTDTSDIVSTWVGKFRGLKLGGPEPIWVGKVPGSETISYAIIGEALQNAWYRFGVGVDDTFFAATRLAESFDLDPPARRKEALQLERVMTARSVQILYHLFGVARNTDQGVVGPVLTEYYMDERHSADLTDARLREVARQGNEMRSAQADLSHADSLVEHALHFQREACCRRALSLIHSLSYPREAIVASTQQMRIAAPDWTAQAWAAISPVLSPEHRNLLSAIFEPAARAAKNDDSAERLRQERLIELGMGRYSWAGPWLRACALRSLDSSTPGAAAMFARVATDPDPLVSETAKSKLAATKTGAPSLIDKALILSEVTLFRSIPHEVLAGVATLLTDRFAAPGEQIFAKGDYGDCLYVVASGRVRIHDGDRTFKVLEARDFFGELSLLDAEPRSASVSALEQTHLFRLGQADFAAVLSEQPAMSHAVSRALCNMVRSANATQSQK